MSFLKTQTFLKLILLFTLFFLVIFGIHLNGAYNNIELKYQLKSKLHNQTNIVNINSLLQNSRSDLLYLADIFHISKFFECDQAQQQLNKVEHFIKSFVENKKVYTQVRIIDTTGKELMRIEYKNGKAVILNEEKLQNKVNRYYFEESTALKKGEIYLSKFDLNIENGIIEEPYNPTIRLSTPITNNHDKVVGYAIVNYAGQLIIDAIKKNNENIKSLLLNNNSYFLVGMKPSDEWGFMFDESINFKHMYPRQWEYMQQHEEGFIHYKNGTFTFLQLNPVRTISPYRTTKSRRNWIIITYVDNATVFSAFMEYFRTILPIVTIFMLIIFTLSYVISRYIQRLKETDERVAIAHAAFENTQEGILVFDSFKRIIQVNRAFVDITGYSEKEAFHQSSEILKDVSYYNTKIFKKIWQTLQEKDYWSGELRNQTKSGKPFIEHLSLSTVKRNGDPIYYIGIFSDITADKKREEDICQTNKILEKTLQELKEAQDQLIESERLSALGQLIASISHEINSPLGAIKTSSSNVLESFNKVVTNVPKLDLLLNEEDKAVLMNLRNMICSENNALSIKELRNLKKELKLQLEQLPVNNARFYADVLSQLHVKNVSPYKALLTHPDAQFILDTLNHEQMAVSNLHNISNSVNRVAKIISSLKKFSYFDHDHEGVVEKLEDSVESTLTLLHHNLKQNIVVIRHFEPLEAIFCHPDELSQVWMNLIQNAIHAMNNQGTLTISISADKNYHTVSITDTGTGIPSTIQKKVFAPFFTTKPSGIGSGLGLGIVKKIIEAHNGKIWFDSNETGTTFYVSIPKEKN